MSEITILHKRIAALARNVGGHPRQILTADVRDPFQAFLTEIEETRLPRILTFQNEIGEMLVCAVHSGRLICIQEDAELEIADFADATEDQKAVLAKICHAFLAQTTKLTVVSKMPEDNSVELGLGFALSRSFLDVDEHATPKKNPPTFQLESFAETMESLSTALVRIDAGEISISHGHEPQCADLLALAQAELSQRAPVTAEQTIQHFVLLSTDQIGRGQAAICAAVQDSVLFAAFPAAEVDQVLQEWTKCRRISP